MNNKTGFVYFMKAMDGNELSPVKIGVTKDIEDRISGVQTGCSYKIKLIGFIETEDYKMTEKVLHAYYSDQRTNGEWFLLTTNEIRRCIALFGKTTTSVCS